MRQVGRQLYFGLCGCVVFACGVWLVAIGDTGIGLLGVFAGALLAAVDWKL